MSKGPSFFHCAVSTTEYIRSSLQTQRNPFLTQVIFSMLLLIVGAGVAAANDLTFTRTGYLWMLANVASNVLHLLVLRKLKLNKDLSNTQILHYSALWSLVWLIPVGHLEGIVNTMRDFVTQPLVFKLVVFSTGINSILMFLATIWCLERTSGSTYSMVGSPRLPPSLGYGL